jgi:YgiT-type zinc finger domain-containing protein
MDRELFCEKGIKMNCFFCKGLLKESLTTHVVKLESCIIIIKGVPCNECAQCGETFFDNKVTYQLDDLVNGLKVSITEVAIINYSAA